MKSQLGSKAASSIESIRSLGEEFSLLPINQQVKLFQEYFQQVFDQRELGESKILREELIFLEKLGEKLMKLSMKLERGILKKSEGVFYGVQNLAIGKDKIDIPQINILSDLLEGVLGKLANIHALSEMNTDFIARYNDTGFFIDMEDTDAKQQAEEMRRDLCGYVYLLQSISSLFTKLPSDGEKILSGSKSYFDQMKQKYGKTQEGFGPHKSIAPIVNNDIKFTAFLEDFVEGISLPEVKSESLDKDSTELNKDDFDFSEYNIEKTAKIIFDCSQESIQELLKVNADIFASVESAYGALAGMLDEIQKTTNQHDLDTMLDIDPREKRGSSDNFEKLVNSLLEEDKNHKRESLKISKEIGDMKLTKIKASQKEDEAHYTKDQKEYRKALGEIFSLIINKIEEVQKKQDDLGLHSSQEEGFIKKVMLSKNIHSTLEEIEEFIREIAVLKYKMEKLGTLGKRKKKKIEKDGESDNHCYSVVTGQSMFGPGGLELQRVPTHDIAYQDIIGASWRKVEQQVNDVLDYAKYQYVHLEMSPRRKMQGNFIVIGPYGCGKNEFMKALMSDERTIGVQTTTDRILSMMFGEFERNVRKLFEISEAKHHEHRKPVIVGWDEFDSMFPGDNIKTTSGNSPYTQAQKILQSVLDGDTPYEGTFLCGVTNEPQKIPVPIYRRFRTVQLIDKLEASERTQLMRHFLNGLPISGEFNNQVDWNYFSNKTDNASGEILGKIADKVFKNYLTDFENKRPQRLVNINSQIQEMLEKGEKLTPEKRRKIFSHGGSPLVTPTMFMSAINDVMGEDAVKHQLNQQVKFYEGVEELLHKAFQGTV